MEKEQYEKCKKELKLPNVKYTKGTVKKTIVGEDGKSYEIEQVIELPVFGKEAK